MDSRLKLLFPLLFGFLAAVDAQAGTNINLKVTEIGATSLTLSWDDQSARDITGYKVFLTLNDGTTREYPTTAPTVVVPNLRPGEAYTLAIAGKKAGDTGYNHHLGDIIQYTAPTPPTGVSFSQPNGTDTIKVTWTPPAGVEVSAGNEIKYKIEYKLDGVMGQMTIPGNEFIFKNLKKKQTLEVLFITALIATNEATGQFVMSERIPVKRNGKTDFDPVVAPGGGEGAGNMLSSMSFLQLATIASTVAGITLFRGLLAFP